MRSELTLGTDPNEVTRMNAWLDESFAAAGLVERLGDDMKLCLNEAVCNVMLYAFAEQPEPTIRVELVFEPDQVEALVRDNGKAFNPLDRPKKDRYTDIDTAVPGGFGIQLIRETASRVDYDRVGDWNELRIVCKAAALSEQR